MKKMFLGLVLAAAVIILAPAVLFAIPQMINYQGRLTDSSGAPVTGSRSMAFSLYTTPSGTARLWRETHTVTVTNGVFSAVLGSYSTIIPSGAFSGDKVYLGVKVGADAEMTPRARITSAGYAFMSGGLMATSGGAVPPLFLNMSSTGEAGVISINNASNGNTALAVTTFGTGMAVNIAQSNRNATASALSVLASGPSNRAVSAVAFGGGVGVYGRGSSPTEAGATSGTGGLFESWGADGTLIANQHGNGPAVTGNTTGTGQAGRFEINNSGSSSDALYATTNGTGQAANLDGKVTVGSSLNVGGAINGSGTLTITRTGTGRAGYFEINNSSSTASALHVKTNGGGIAVEGWTNGTGSAGNFSIANTSNNANALNGETTGGGSAIYGITSGTGRAGEFGINNTSNSNPALSAGTIGAGSGLYATTSGTGSAVYGYATGTGRAGAFEVSNASSGAGALLTQTNGTGHAGVFEIYNASNSNNALLAETNGIGNAGKFNITNSSSAADALYAVTNGLGNAGYFWVNNSSNGNNALYGTTNGAGAGVIGVNQGTGRAGDFEINNASNAAAALYVTTNGTGPAAYFDGRVVIANPQVPASASATGTTGQIAWDSSYVYICVGTNQWKRAALSSW